MGKRIGKGQTDGRQISRTEFAKADSVLRFQLSQGGRYPMFPGNRQILFFDKQIDIFLYVNYNRINT